MFKREAEGDSSMTISAQVIDTIVEWIDDNLHQPLRIEEIARMLGGVAITARTRAHAAEMLGLDHA